MVAFLGTSVSLTHIFGRQNLLEIGSLWGENKQKGSLVVKDHLPSNTFLINLWIVSKIWHWNLGSNFIHSSAPQTQNKIDLK